MMSSSTMHIAQHPSGTTIVRQQSMSATGLPGQGVAQQQTMMQQHALPNGIQVSIFLLRIVNYKGLPCPILTAAVRNHSFFLNFRHMLTY